MVALHGRARPVGGQFQQGRAAGELLLPPREAGGQRLEALALPDGEVAVLHRQFRQGRRPAGVQGGVDGGEFAEEDRERPAVEDDVVHRQQEDVVGLRELEQLDAEEGHLPQVERAPRLFARDRAGLRLAGLGGPEPQVGHGQLEGQGRRDDLHGLVLLQGEGGAQRLMPRDKMSKRVFERRGIERPRHPDGDRDIVERATGLQLLEKPQAVLGGRGREEIRFGRSFPVDGDGGGRVHGYFLGLSAGREPASLVLG